jgi:hypothetical protein
MSNEIIKELMSLVHEVCDSPLLNEEEVKTYKEILMEQLKEYKKCEEKATYSRLKLKTVKLDMECSETDKKYNKKPEERYNAISKEIIEKAESSVMITDLKADVTIAAAKAAITFIKKLLATKTMETSQELTQEVEAREVEAREVMFLNINIIVRGVNLSSKPQNSVAGVSDVTITKSQRNAALVANRKIKEIFEEEKKKHYEEILVLKANSEADTEAHTTQTQVVAQAVVKAPALESEAHDVAQVATKTQYFEDIEVSDEPFS